MTDNLQITCINKTPRLEPHERINAVGGLNPNGVRFHLTLDEAIAGVQTGRWKFYTHVGGKSVWVVVARSASGRLYLKTENDGEQPNNLLSLPECP